MGHLQLKLQILKILSIFYLKLIQIKNTHLYIIQKKLQMNKMFLNYLKQLQQFYLEIIGQQILKGKKQFLMRTMQDSKQKNKKQMYIISIIFLILKKQSKLKTQIKMKQKKKQLRLQNTNRDSLQKYLKKLKLSFLKKINIENSKNK